MLGYEDYNTQISSSNKVPDYVSRATYTQSIGLYQGNFLYHCWEDTLNDNKEKFLEQIDEFRNDLDEMEGEEIC